MRIEVSKKRLQLMKRANTKVRELILSGVPYDDERIKKINKKLDKDLSNTNDFLILLK